MVENKSTSKLEKDILEKLQFEPGINHTKILVSVKEDGVVTLFGSVSSYYERNLAELAVCQVAGVHALANELGITLDPHYQRSDTEIATAVLHALQWHVSIPKDALMVTVQDGKVKLSGEVDWWYQRESAEKAVSHLVGVKDIVNQITIRAKVSPDDVKKSIMREFHRHATLDAENIEIAISAGRVTLTGNVASIPEMHEAARAAWSVPGVIAVDNQLAIAKQETAYSE